MKNALKTRPKPAFAIVPKPAPQLPLDDAEAAALFLTEIMPPEDAARAGAAIGRLGLADVSRLHTAQMKGERLHD